MRLITFLTLTNCNITTTTTITYNNVHSKLQSQLVIFRAVIISVSLSVLVLGSFQTILRNIRCRVLNMCKVPDIRYCITDSGLVGIVKYFHTTLREKSSQTNVILQYKLLASILSAACSLIQQS